MATFTKENELKTKEVGVPPCSPSPPMLGPSKLYCCPGMEGADKWQHLEEGHVQGAEESRYTFRWRNQGEVMEKWQGARLGEFCRWVGRHNGSEAPNTGHLWAC